MCLLAAIDLLFLICRCHIKVSLIVDLAWVELETKPLQVVSALGELDLTEKFGKDLNVAMRSEVVRLLLILQLAPIIAVRNYILLPDRQIEELNTQWIDEQIKIDRKWATLVA